MKTGNEITIHDIARELKISASTVSRALNNNPRISKATKEKIREAALKMGYRPNSIASQLRTKKTNTIGVVIPRISRHFFSSAISGIEDVAYRNGYSVIITQSEEDYEREKLNVQSLFSNRVDGIIVSLAMGSENFDHFKLFTDKKIPLVFFDRYCQEISTPQVLIDDFEGGYQATKHLIEQGCRNIVHIGGPQKLNIYANRLKGYQQALEDARIRFKESNFYVSDLTRKAGERIVEEIFAAEEKPDAIFCANDTSALSIIQYAKANGIRIPEDLCIIGFSNEPYSELLTPSLSTVAQPGFEMGQTAAEMVIKQITEKTIEDTKIIMPTQLIIRESTLKKQQ
ncbi:LacI family transcriptional regulator [Prolixibacteraceae bacterium JC049]|nr:LacI family transcriptional regulator [Prolixibacteraceae bacterium JC049]